MEIKLIQVTDVDNVWPSLAEGFEQACLNTGGDINASYLWGQCRGGNAYLFVIIDAGKLLASSVWRFENWSTGKKFRCLALFGENFPVWKTLHEAFILKVAALGDANGLIAEGRKGLERLFPNARVFRQLYEVAL